MKLFSKLQTLFSRGFYRIFPLEIFGVDVFNEELQQYECFTIMHFSKQPAIELLAEHLESLTYDYTILDQSLDGAHVLNSVAPCSGISKYVVLPDTVEDGELVPESGFYTAEDVEELGL